MLKFLISYTFVSIKDNSPLVKNQSFDVPENSQKVFKPWNEYKILELSIHMLCYELQ